jgi:uncharacterized SAM-binding protein YcdF (DUF218 family)
MGITAQAAMRITRYLDLHTPVPDQVDLVFVFGTRHPEPAYMASDLMRRGVGRYVVLTGGRNRLTGVNEAHAHLGIVLGQGVPRASTIVEDASSNTLENVVLALPRIAANMDVGKIASIAVVTKWYHVRRAIMTLKRHLPEGVRYFAVTYEPQDVRCADWWQSMAGTRRVIKEVHHIPKYLAAGDIAELREENGGFI